MFARKTHKMLAAAGETNNAKLPSPELQEKAITGATSAAPIVLTIVGHEMLDGQPTHISGMPGDFAALNNKAYTITVIDADTVSLDGTDGSAYAAFSAGGSETAHYHTQRHSLGEPCVALVPFTESADGAFHEAKNGGRKTITGLDFSVPNAVIGVGNYTMTLAGISNINVPLDPNKWVLAIYVALAPSSGAFSIGGTVGLNASGLMSQISFTIGSSAGDVNVIDVASPLLNYSNPPDFEPLSYDAAHGIALMIHQDVFALFANDTKDADVTLDRAATVSRLESIVFASSSADVAYYGAWVYQLTERPTDDEVKAAIAWHKEQAPQGNKGSYPGWLVEA